MGFFSELKEDLSQAVSELVMENEEVTDTAGEERESASGPEEQESILPRTSEDLGRMLESMDLDGFAEPEEPEEMPDDLPEISEEIADDLPEEMEEDLPEEPEETAVDLSEIMGNTENNMEMREEEVQQEEARYRTMETENVMVTGDVTDETAIITAGMVIKGDISSQGSLEVVGTVEGNINILGKLNITGTIDGASTAADVYAEKARINGDVQSSASIKIGQNTIIIGNIYATSAVIAGAVKGDIDVKGPVILDDSAIVMGNIKSKSVQINNGAVIEGLCSQCYADVNPSSFFEDIKKARK